MATNNAVNIATGATSTVLTGQGVGSTPTFSATPTVTSITFGSGDPLNRYNGNPSFTPTLVGQTSAGVTTYNSQTGSYTRVGNLVTVWIDISISAATGTGNVNINGLPFASNVAATTGIYFDGSGWTWPAGRTSVCAYLAAGSSTIKIIGSGSSVSATNMQMANAAMEVILALTYEAT